MAEIVKDTNVILKWIEEKQRNEQAMLFRLNNLFKGSIPRHKMRRMVLAAFEQMSREASDVSTAGPAIFAVNDEKNLAVWSRVQKPSNIAGVKLVRMTNQLIAGDKAVPRLDCNDFSELIRVIGAWLEKGGGFGAPNINKAYRVGAGRVKRTEDTIYEYLIYLMDLKKKYGDQSL